MRTERLDTTTAGGRRVAVWRSTAAAPRAGVAVLAAGFGQRMRSLGPLALFLVLNGLIVYRFDAVDHVGLSDGDIRDYSLGAQYDSLAAVCELARAAEQVPEVCVCATSLAALGAFHYAARPGVAQLICQLGVVNGRRTLLAATGTDYAATDWADLPDVVQMDRHLVDPRPLWLEYRDHGWLNPEATADALAAIAVPVTNFVAAQDEWVTAAEVRELFAAAAGHGPREVVELPMTGHALLRNPVALSAMFTEVTRLALGAGPGAPIAAPGFEDVLAVRAAERELDHAQREPEPQPAAGPRGRS